MNLGDLSHKSEALVLGLCLDHAPVHAGQPDGVSALVFNQRDKALVDLSRKNHLYGVCGFLVGDAQTVHKYAFFPDFLQHIGDFRTAAVYQHDLDAYQI